MAQQLKQVEDKLCIEPQSVNGKAVLVTGGTTGIGRATVLLLAAHGARVLLLGRHNQELEDTMADVADLGAEAYGMTADMAEEEAIHEVFETADEKLGGLDILVNNAALGAQSLADPDHDDWRYIVEVNLLGYMACCEAAIPRMRKRGGGHIVNIGSMSADVREEGSDIYVATKSGIQGFSAALRKRVNKDGIKVSLIEPGAVGTDMSGGTPAEQQAEQAKMKILKAEDIAACVYYCLTQPQRCDVVSVQIRPHQQFV